MKVIQCDDDDNDILIYCKQCLCELIEDYDNKCPINNHTNPSIIPSQGIRRQISKSIVICPYSLQYKQFQRNTCNDLQHIIDTAGYSNEEAKEGDV